VILIEEEFASMIPPIENMANITESESLRPRYAIPPFFEFKPESPERPFRFDRKYYQ
jgi:hypothetical protein